MNVLVKQEVTEMFLLVNLIAEHICSLQFDLCKPLHHNVLYSSNYSAKPHRVELMHS